MTDNTRLTAHNKLNQVDKTHVREMFNRIAGRYDLMNDLLSFGMHRYWSSSAIKLFTKKGHCLDLACGTGALFKALIKKFSKVTGADFSEEMLQKADEQYQSEIKSGRLELRQVDAHQLIFEDQAFDAVSVAYGVRNFENLPLALQQIYRVLKPDGELLIIEFGYATGFFAFINRLYINYFLPLIARLFSKDHTAYTYLAQSMNEFPAGEEFVKILQDHGFEVIKTRKFLSGITNVYFARRVG